jgi:hypothetical protein
MSELDFAVEPKVECSDDDPNDTAFVQAIAAIRGRDVVEEYVACKMIPLAIGFGFKSMSVGMTLVSKVETCLPQFTMGTIAVEHADHFLVDVETDAERVLGSFGPREYDALTVANIPNSGHLNRVFEQIGVSYAPHPLPSSEASQVANEKRKAEVSKKPTAKKMKAGKGQAWSSKMVPPLAKTGSVKKVEMSETTWPKAKPRPRGTSEIELALPKPIGVSKMFCLLDVVASSHGPHVIGVAVTHTT